MNTIIYTSYPCLIKCGDKQEQLNPNEHLTIEEQFEKISVYRANKSKNSFDIDLNKKSPFYRVINKENSTLIFLLDGLFAENISCHDFNYNGTKSKVEIGQKSITFSGVKDKKIIHLSGNEENIKVGAFLYMDYVFFEDNGQQALIVYNPKKNTAKIFQGEKIEIEKDGFSLRITNFNYKQIEEIYFVDKDGLKIKDKKFVTAESISSLVEVIPYKFMVAIKCGDYNNAISMLSRNLAQKLSIQTLKNYFGEISYFYMLSPYTCFALSNNENKIYEFAIENDKIVDISD